MRFVRTSAFLATLAFAAVRPWAVGFSSGSNSGNWTYLNPSSARVGIGTSSSTNPPEKLQVKGGNILIDNNRSIKAYYPSGTSTQSLLSFNTSSALLLYGGKVLITPNGDMRIGPVPPFATLGVDGSGYFTKTLQVDGQVSTLGNLFSFGPFATFSSNVFNDVSDFYSTVDIHSDLNVTGTKNFVQAHPTDDTKKIVYVAVEAGEALTHARGLAKTVDGAVKIPLPEHFALVTSDDLPVTVLLTAEGAPATLYVAAKSKKEIEVRIKKSDFEEFGDVSFGYQVEGVRDGFGDHQAIQDIDKPAPVSAKRKAILARSNAMCKRKHK